MIKKLFALLLVLSFASKTPILAQVFEKEKNYVTAGYGLNGINGFYKSLKTSYGSNNDFKVKAFGPLVFNYERGIKDRWGVGLQIDYSKTSISFRPIIQEASFDNNFNIIYTNKVYNTEINLSILSAVFSGYYHYKLKNDKLDAYSGFGIGFVKIGMDTKTDQPNFTPIGIGAMGVGYKICSGARYMFTDKIGAYAEIALGYSFLHGGLVIKL